MKIDIVYNYVNGNDQDWIEQRNRYARDNKKSECRFRDNGELKYSLRSLEKYAPWIGDIYIVSDSKMPEWLDKKNKKLHVVDHSEFMPKELLPCYNSNVIEAFLPFIRGLSEIFLYANDDMMFGNNVSEAFFVQDGKPVVRMIEEPSKDDCYYNRVMSRTKKLIEEKFGIHFNLNPWHNIDVYKKESMIQCMKCFQKEFLDVNRNRFRADNDIQRAIFQYYMLQQNECSLVKYNNRNKGFKLIQFAKQIISPKKYSDYLIFDISDFVESGWKKRLFTTNPRVFCINDGERTTQEAIVKYQEHMKEKFPEKSSFEI